MTRTRHERPLALGITWLSFDELSTRQLYEVLRLRQDVFVIEQRCIYRDTDPASW
jgi:ElaA protein